MNRSCAFRVAQVAAMCLALNNAACAQEQLTACLPYSPVVVTLTGSLRLEHRLGPPGYGENPQTDRRMAILVLRLRQSISTCGQPGDPVNPDSLHDVTEIQLVVTARSEASALVGQRVQVRGTLEQATLGPHFTAVVMSVIEIQPASSNLRRT